jgi:threonylcarbamoyladenosine tRNA methylthiotransferase MtaB
MTEPSVVTLGCRLNGYESECMRAHAKAAGLNDAIIVNTCAVTAEAVRQATQTIRKLRREHPVARIIVTGCAAQIEPERFAGLLEVDHVIGNAEKMAPQTFADLAAMPRVQVGDIMAQRETLAHRIDPFACRARAWVQVQNGCDHRCTFCIIPYGRGPSRSVPATEVVAQVRHLAEAGTSEVVLTGVDMTSYGADLPEAVRLGTLVRRVLREVPELKRLRLSSFDCIEADGDLLVALAEEQRLMPHLHLSLQAGDDLILKRMKRRHTRADAIRFCDEARRLRPGVVFGADLIAGFPTETTDMFTRSLDLVDECGLTYLHVFPFSARPGTPAARMPQVNKAEIKTRAGRLRAKGEAVLSTYLDRQIGRTTSVAVERDGTHGRTPEFCDVRLSAPCGPGALVDVRVTGTTDRLQLTGAAL